MQQVFQLNEPVAAQRLAFLFPTTDGVTGKTSGVAGNKAQISIGSNAFVDTINAIVQFTGMTTYPLYYVQLESSEIATLGHGIICYEGDVWFAGIFKVEASSSALSLDAVFTEINKNRLLLKDIQWRIDKVDKKLPEDLFISPL